MVALFFNGVKGVFFQLEAKASNVRLVPTSVAIDLSPIGEDITNTDFVEERKNRALVRRPIA